MNTGASRWLYIGLNLGLITVLVAGLVLGSPRPVEAATITVDDDYTAATPGWGTTAFATIQEAVNVAADGDTVDVKAGTYVEQVTISKNITLSGEDKLTTIIRAPLSMNQDCTSPLLTNSPVICVNNGFSPTIQGFTVDGLSSGASHQRLMGIAIRNAGGIIQDNIIKNIGFGSPNGAEEGVGIYLYNNDQGTRSISILNNTIYGFNKNGITLTSHSSWDPVSFLIQGNTITGFGPNQTIVQNGIQVELPRGGGTITSNTISNIAFNNSNNPQALVAVSILNLGDPANLNTITTAGNTITGAQGGVYYFDGKGLISNNTIAVVNPSSPGLTGKIAFGILASDPPWAVPSPYDSTYISDSTSKNALNASALQAELGVEVAANTVSFGGISSTNTVGIASEAGLAEADLNINIHDNSVSGFENGIGLYYCLMDYSCPTGRYTGLRVVSNNLAGNINAIKLTGTYLDLLLYPFNPEIHHNRIVGNTVGIFNDAIDFNSGQPIPITAHNNWWGCNTGPDTTGCDVSVPAGWEGSVDFDPWLKLTATLPPTPIQAGDSAALVANLITNSLDEDTSTGGFYVPSTMLADFTADFGNLNPDPAAFALGLANSTYTAPTSQTSDHICVTVDSETVCTDTVVEPLPVFTVFLPLINR